MKHLVSTWDTTKPYISALAIIAVVGFTSVAVAEPPPAGPFSLPFDENQSWKACRSTGWKPYGDPESHQYHIQWYSVVGKYHLGEDWNGICGGSSDKNAPLFAIADGDVVYADRSGTISGKGKQLIVRHSIPYAFGDKGVLTFDSVYLHLNQIDDDVEWSGAGTGSSVRRGQKVAYVGDTGTASAHLHWEAQRDLSLPLAANPYQNPLTSEYALRYLPPSLVVDDRRSIIGLRVPEPGKWYSFTMNGDAPSSSAYIKYAGQRKSLRNAIAAGWIPKQGILHEDGGRWYYFADVDDNFFEDGERYAIRTNVSSAVHYIPVPRNGFQGDRARLDILHEVKNDGRFISLVRSAGSNIDRYGHKPSWSSSYELHWLRFDLASGGTTNVYQATNKSNPLRRYVGFYDPDTRQWSGWSAVGWNELY